MSLERILAEFEQLRQDSERGLLGQEVTVPSFGDVDEFELVGLSQPSSPDQQLRGLAVQVEAARLSQDDELDRRTARLEGIKDELVRCGRARLKLRHEVGSLVLDVSRHQSMLAKAAAEGGQLQEAIADLTVEVADLRARLAFRTQQHLTSRRLFSRYNKKMDNHECQFVSAQRNCPAVVEVAGLREALAGLVHKRAVPLKVGEVGVLSGQKNDVLRAALEDVKDRAVAAVSRQRVAKEQAASHRQKRDKVVQASNLLKKRNQAQLLRVKRQLQECHAHKRRWAEETSRLQATISQLKGDTGGKPISTLKGKRPNNS